MSTFNPLNHPTSVLSLWLALGMGLLIWPNHNAFGQSNDNDQALTVKNLWPAEIEIGNRPSPILDSTFSELWLEALKHEETELQQELISSMEKVSPNGN